MYALECHEKLWVLYKIDISPFLDLKEFEGKFWRGVLEYSTFSSFLLVNFSKIQYFTGFLCIRTQLYILLSWNLTSGSASDFILFFFLLQILNCNCALCTFTVFSYFHFILNNIYFLKELTFSLLLILLYNLLVFLALSFLPLEFFGYI